ncbi:hypothetical protein, partial [Hymenobacter agri]
ATLAAAVPGGPALGYVDGQAYLLDNVPGEAYLHVASMKILNGPQVQQALGRDVLASRVFVITTLANRERADVRALNQKVDAAGATDAHFKVETTVRTNHSQVPAHQLPDGIKAYIARTYPGSTLNSWLTSSLPAVKVPHAQYFANVTTSTGEKRKLYFNAAEQPVAGPAAPAAAPKLPPLVYLDGQRYAGNINDIGPNNIANISVFKGEKAVQRFGAAAADGVLVVTSVAHQHDAAVRAFNGEADAAMATP